MNHLTDVTRATERGQALPAERWAPPIEPCRRSSPAVAIVRDGDECSICGAEHDPDETPELDSTHLCPDCVTALVAQSRASITALPAREP